MSLTHINGALNLLGQAETAVPLVAPRLPAGAEGPRLDVGWGDFHQGVGSNVQTLFARGAAKRFLSGGFFKDCWIESRWPRRAIVAALLWHVAFLAMPFPKGALGPKKVSGLENFQLTWSGPIQDLPLLEIPKARAKNLAKAAAVDPAPQPGADAFHPRQRIFTDPVRPTHAKQTLVNPKAPMEAPKLLPEMPNMVELAATTGPAKPKVTISQDALKQLHPHERRVKLVKVAPPEDAPVLAQEQMTSELNIPATENGPARPKLEINAGVAPRAARRDAVGEVAAAAPAPEIGGSAVAGGASAQTLIALSATPGPAAPAAPPAGNLAAKVSISPDGGKKGGAESAGAAGGGKSPVGVSISGGNPPASKSAISGLGAGMGARSMRSLSARPQEPSGSEDEAVRVGPPDFKALPAGANPEQIFVGKRTYTMNVNMPNLSSATGSWILNFAELHVERPHITSTDLSSPVVLRKVDPKYPPTLVAERVEGEVVLYGVIGADGSVGQIQIVRGVDDQLDENAKAALAQWKFRPATKAGEAIEVEVIAHIPFRIPPKE
jgi:TonB family protein